MSAIVKYTTSFSHSTRLWLKHHFLEKKLSSGIGYLMMAVITYFVVWPIVMINYKLAIVPISIVGVILVLVVVMKYPTIGLYFGFVYSSIISTLSRLFDPINFFGLLEIPVYLLVFMSVMLKREYKNELDRKFLTSSITMGLYLLLCWWVLQAFNPSMFSRLGWLSYFRNHLFIIIFYIICYCLLNSKSKTLFFSYFFIGLSTFFALYACKQEWIGFFEFEARTIRNNPNMQALLIQGGMTRRFSVFSDPAASGICFACVTVQCLVLAWRGSLRSRLWLIPAAIINILGYSYSGTRTATLAIAGGLAFYIIATLHEKRTFKFLGIVLVMVLGLKAFQSNNQTVARMQSAFNSTKDASANLRDYNRHAIQPYILAHPMGGGVYTCGAEGPKYNPGHFLEKFQPDSGYAKTMAEEGTIGLAILLFFYLLVTREGIRNFYRAVDPEIRNHYIASLCMFFSLLIAQYAQLSVSQSPISLYFFGTMVIFTKLVKYDTKEANV